MTVETRPEKRPFSRTDPFFTQGQGSSRQLRRGPFHRPVVPSSLSGKVPYTLGAFILHVLPDSVEENPGSPVHPRSPRGSRLDTDL